MSKHTLVLLTKVKPEFLLIANCVKNYNVLREEIFNQVSKFLMPYQGKKFGAFEPASVAWDQSLYHPYGVVLGAEDIGLFMYFYSTARYKLEENVEKMCRDNFFSNASPVFKGNKDGRDFSAFIVDPQKICESEAVVKVFSGDFHADLGFYSLEHRKALLNPDEWDEAMRNTSQYALCILDIALA